MILKNTLEVTVFTRNIVRQGLSYNMFMLNDDA